MASRRRARNDHPESELQKYSGDFLEFAAQFAGELPKAKEAEEDGIPRLMPISAGRHGKALIVVKLPTLKSEGEWIAERLKEAHAKNVPWRDMAILYRHYDPVCKAVRAELRRAGIPNTWKDDVSFGEHQDTVKLLPFHSKQRPRVPDSSDTRDRSTTKAGRSQRRRCRLLYVAMTRATSQLIVTGASA
ncbi:MAG: hypothetical protein M5R42_15190 [Rhodocyclaceae bacterium]|nr:hypothetical protein [Rhodocyclaceae bacterium]